MWTTHVNAITDKDGYGQQMSMPALTRMDVDNTCVNTTTDKDGCGKQHMSTPPLTRMDVDNICQCYH
jgi:hypothetical protein